MPAPSTSATPSEAELEALLERIESEAAALAQAELSGVEGPVAARVRRRVRSVRDLLGGVSARLLAVVEDDGWWAASGSARTVAEWGARQDGASIAAARQEARLGKALGSASPVTSRALGEGQVSVEHAQILAQVAAPSPERVAGLGGGDPSLNEEHLLTQTTKLGADEFRREVRRAHRRTRSCKAGHRQGSDAPTADGPSHEPTDNH